MTFSLLSQLLEVVDNKRSQLLAMQAAIIDHVDDKFHVEVMPPDDPVGQLTTLQASSPYLLITHDKYPNAHADNMKLYLVSDHTWLMPSPNGATHDDREPLEMEKLLRKVQWHF